jgi:uncharacterized repeat protein (TIGR03803 family)
MPTKHNDRGSTTPERSAGVVGALVKMNSLLQYSITECQSPELRAEFRWAIRLFFVLPCWRDSFKTLRRETNLDRAEDTSPGGFFASFRSRQSQTHSQPLGERKVIVKQTIQHKTIIPPVRNSIKRLPWRRGFILIPLALAWFAVSPAPKAFGAAQASTTNVIYSFAGNQDGEYTDTDLVIDSAGNLYGTSVLGGAFGSGTVFRLTPSGNRWIHTVLYSFTGGTDGGEPYKGVTLDAHGNLYGTAVTGGTGGCEGGCGVAYKLTHSGRSWSQTVIHYFSGGNDGSGPGAGLTIDHHGNLYGVTPTGGANGLGVVYRLNQDASGNWTLTVLHTFTGGTDGATGSAGRLLFHGGRLYGVATAGGANGKGIAYELKPSQAGEWTLTTIYAFRGQPDAGFPYGSLLLGTSGKLYGTTYYDGANNLGSVYELSRTSPSAARWNERVLYSFRGGSDGQNSLSNLVIDADGNLYGTTSEGGASGSYGTIFKLTPGAHGTWTESVAHRFQGPPDGASAYNGMVADAEGNFYGATVHGGGADDGTIYQFTPDE